MCQILDGRDRGLSKILLSQHSIGDGAEVISGSRSCSGVLKLVERSTTRSINLSVHQSPYLINDCSRDCLPKLRALGSRDGGLIAINWPVSAVAWTVLPAQRHTMKPHAVKIVKRPPCAAPPPSSFLPWSTA